MSSPIRKMYLGVMIAGIASAAALVFMQAVSAQSDGVAEPTAQPSLSVNVTTLAPQTLPTTIAANGDIAAWQEIIIGNEIGGLRLVDVKVDVGDEVTEGQVLAVYNDTTVRAELARSRAAVAEAEATLAEANANAQRARSLKTTGSLSEQQIQQYETAELTAQARLNVAQAQNEAQALRLAQTQVVAPDDGLITTRTATLGAITGTDQELFRLMRHGRLEWRAEVAASELHKLRPGQSARVTLSGGYELDGRLRTIAPLVDTATRNGLVYVDLPVSDVARAGMFARGEFELGTRRAMTLPQSAVLLRDGFSYVMRLGPDSRVVQTKVTTGQRVGERIEIAGGIEASAQVVASGGAFLGDGDLVRVVEEPSAWDAVNRAEEAP